MSATASPRRPADVAPLVLAAAVPLVFLHSRYQPSVHAGTTIRGSDVAVVAVIVAAAIVGRRDGVRLPGTRWIWGALATLAVVIVASTAWGAAHYAAYPAGTHATTAVKWIEYMLLAPAVAIILRRPADAIPSAFVAVIWSIAATIVGLLQFVGLISDLDHLPPGSRQSSFLGYHDFSGFSAAVLVVSLLALSAPSLSPQHRRLAQAGTATGVVGLVLGGAFDAVLGLVLALAALVVWRGIRQPRRLVPIAISLALVAAGTIAIRSGDVANGLQFVGVKQGNGGASTRVQTYRQRTLLAYIGGRIFLAHPVFGVGFEGSTEEYAYGPFLADAHRRFDQPAVAFPSPAHPWGVQNAVIQALADMGVPGLVVLLAALLVPVALVRRRMQLTAIAGGLVVLVSFGVWNGYGLVAGIPLDALTWAGAGMVAASLRWPAALSTARTTRPSA